MNSAVAKTSKVCTACNVIVPDEGSWKAHIAGKRHQQQTSRQDDRFEKSQRSIYCGNLPPGTNETILFNYFMRYADVTEVILDKNQARFAIIEFANADSIGYVLQQKHFLSDRRLAVQRRKLKAEPQTNIPKKELRRAEEARSNEERNDQVRNQLISSSNLAEQMEDLLNVLKLSNQDIDHRSRFIEELIQTLRRYFSYSEVHVYGSSINGLGQQGCDLDILVSLRPESDECYQVEDNPNQQRSAKRLFQGAERGYKINPEQLCDLSIKDVTFLLKLILSKVPHCQGILLIPSKRCPIVRFTHGELGISCDVSVKHRLCLANTNLIRLFSNLDRRVLLLFFAIKYWAQVHEIGGGGGARLSSYSVVMLVIFYLQNTVPQILPTVTQLHQMEGKPRTIAGWDCSFCNVPNRIPLSKNKLSVDELLKNFFCFYADFDFATYAVCPRTGEEFPKTQLAEVIPNAVEKPLCVQDPFELSHNLTANVSDKVLYTLWEGLRRGSIWAKTPHMWAPNRDGSDWGILSLFEHFVPTNVHPGIPRLAGGKDQGVTKPSPQQQPSQATKSKQPPTQKLPPKPDIKSPAQKLPPKPDIKTPVQKSSPQTAIKSPMQKLPPTSTQTSGPQSNPKSEQQYSAQPTQSSSYWSTQKRAEQGAVQPPYPAPVGKATFWSTAKRDVTLPLPQAGAAKMETALKPTTINTTPIKTTPIKTTPSVPKQTGAPKPVDKPIPAETNKSTTQQDENNVVLPSPIRAWPPITTAIIHQTSSKRKRKSKLKAPKEWDPDANVSTFAITASKISVEKVMGVPQSNWDSMTSEVRNKWSREFFQLVYTLLSDALQMPCSELEITKSTASDAGNSNEGSNIKRIKIDKRNLDGKQEGSSVDTPKIGELIATFVCSVYHRTWERRRHFKQRLVPTTPPKPYLEVEEKVSMLIIDTLPSTPEKPLFSFKCRIDSTEDPSQFIVHMTPTAYSAEFAGVALDFYESFVPKAMLKILLERSK